MLRSNCAFTDLLYWKHDISSDLLALSKFGTDPYMDWERPIFSDAENDFWFLLDFNALAKIEGKMWRVLFESCWMDMQK